MANKRLAPVHPGEVLEEEFLKPLNLSQHRLALDIGVDPRRINEIVLRKRSVTANTALLLARYFETSPEFWLGLQAQYDLDIEEDKMEDRLDREVRIYAEMEVGTKLEVVDRAFKKIETIAKREVHEARNMETFIGGSYWRGRRSHTGQMRISLKPESERSRSSEEIASVLRRKLINMPGVQIRTRAGRGLFLLRMGTQGGERVEVG